MKNAIIVILVSLVIAVGVSQTARDGLSWTCQQAVELFESQSAASGLTNESDSSEPKLVLSPTPVPQLPAITPVDELDQQPAETNRVDVESVQRQIAELAVRLDANSTRKKLLETTYSQLLSSQTVDEQRLATLLQAVKLEPNLDGRNATELSIKALEYQITARKVRLKMVKNELGDLEASAKTDNLERLALLAGLSEPITDQLAEGLIRNLAEPTNPRTAFTEQFALLLAGDIDQLKSKFSQENQPSIGSKEIESARKKYLQKSVSEIGNQFMVDETGTECRVVDANGNEVNRMQKRPDGQWVSTKLWFQ